MKNAAQIQNDINSAEKNLSTLQGSETTYKNRLAELNPAKDELNEIKQNFDNDFMTGYPKMILKMESRGLKGMENIQTKVGDAFSSGRNKQRFDDIINKTLSEMDKQITNITKNLEACQRNITNTKQKIANLKQQLAALP